MFLTYIGSIDILYKYTCIELKAGRATEDDLAQTLRYEGWLTRKLADGDHEMLQGVLVANSFSDKLLEYVLARKRIEERTIRLMTYQIDTARKEVIPTEIEG